MAGWIDRLSFGPARRRRRNDRRLRALEREYVAMSAGRATGKPPRGGGDPTARVAIAIAVACAVGAVAVQPTLVPASVRELVGFGPERLAEAPTVRGTGEFAFIAHQPGDATKPVAYDPCRELRVRINPASAPPGGVDLVRDAMADVARATGLVLRFDGLTTERPKWESPHVPSFLGQLKRRPALVSWATQDEVPQLSGEVAGIGGSAADAGRDGVVRYVTGGVTLDAHSFARLAVREDGPELMRAIVLHELGHLVGLAHVQDARELMYADNVGLLDYGTGDRLGLAALGSGSCE